MTLWMAVDGYFEQYLKRFYRQFLMQNIQALGLVALDKKIYINIWLVLIILLKLMWPLWFVPNGSSVKESSAQNKCWLTNRKSFFKQTRENKFHSSIFQCNCFLVIINNITAKLPGLSFTPLKHGNVSSSSSGFCFSEKESDKYYIYSQVISAWVI